MVDIVEGEVPWPIFLARNFPPLDVLAVVFVAEGVRAALGDEIVALGEPSRRCCIQVRVVREKSIEFPAERELIRGAARGRFTDDDRVNAGSLMLDGSHAIAESFCDLQEGTCPHPLKHLKGAFFSCSGESCCGPPMRSMSHSRSPGCSPRISFLRTGS
jgi:hypothetical protein